MITSLSWWCAIANYIICTATGVWLSEPRELEFALPLTSCHIWGAQNPKQDREGFSILSDSMQQPRIACCSGKPLKEGCIPSKVLQGQAWLQGLPLGRFLTLGGRLDHQTCARNRVIGNCIHSSLMSLIPHPLYWVFDGSRSKTKHELRASVSWYCD